MKERRRGGGGGREGGKGGWVPTNHAGCPVPYLIVLGLGQLYQQLGYLVLHVHLAEDGRSIVSDGHITIRAHHHLVHTWST